MLSKEQHVQLAAEYVLIYSSICVLIYYYIHIYYCIGVLIYDYIHIYT